MTDYGKRLIYDTAAQHRLVALARQRGSDFIPLDMITYILFNDTPAVDAREVVHGRWERVAAYNDGVLNTVACSVCKTCQPVGAWDYYSYCMHCGAEMDGE